MTSRVLIASLLAVLLCTAIPAQGQEKEIQKQVKVRIRLVPVTVKDRDGKPLKGLKAEDFELKVDGKPMTIRSVDEYDYSVLREEIRQGKRPQITGDVLPKRRIILLFDVFSSDWREDGDSTDQPARTRGIRQSKSAAKKWVESELLPTDEVAVIAYTNGPQLIQPYTANKESILKAIEQVRMPQRMKGEFIQMEDESGGGEQGTVMNINVTDPSAAELRQGTKAYLGFYDRLGQLLASLPGTKNVILFSEGVMVHQDNMELSYEPEMQRATAALGGSGTRIASVNIAGLERQRTGSYYDEFLNGLAHETGGEYFPSRGRLDGSITDAAASFDHFYELSFSPAENESADFHDIAVTVKAETSRVMAPTGFIGEKSFDQANEAQRDVAVDQGFWRPLLANDLGAEFATAILPYADGKAALHIRASLPVRDKGGAREYDVALNLGRDGELFDQARWRSTIAFIPNGQFDLLIPLPPGQTSFQFALTDRDSGDRAFLINAFTVPEGLPSTTMSAVYLMHDASPAGEETELVTAPKKLDLTLPDPLRKFVRFLAAPTARGGEKLQIAFIFRGKEITDLYVQLTQGDNQEQLKVDKLTQEPLADGLRIVKAVFPVPAWGEGPVEVLIAATGNGKAYKLGTTTFSIAP